MMRLFLIFSICVSGGFGGTSVFDLSDVDFPLAYLWNTPNNLLNQQQNVCNVSIETGERIQGVCKSRAECYLTGGVPKGLCGLLATCCTYSKSCGRRTHSKVSYFTSESYRGQQRQCKYDVRIINPRICQLRIDFHKLHLSQPIMQTVGQTSMYKCVDRFEIPQRRNTIPVLCGRNDGQHIYVEVNGTLDTQISLQLYLRERSVAETFPAWNIEVTQLECAGYRNAFSVTDNHAAYDFDYIAPRYALQYFTTQSGHIRSFGFDDFRSDNKYSSGQKYAIAFKKTESDCGIEFVVDYLELHSQATSNPRLPACNDYLFIPGLEYDDVFKVCHVPKTFALKATPPGPLYIYFYSAQSFPATMAETNLGYKLYYNFTSCNP